MEIIHLDEQFAIMLIFKIYNYEFLEFEALLKLS